MILINILSCTNISIEKISDNCNRDRYARRTNLIEIKELIGLFYLCAICESSNVYTRDIWLTNGTGLYILHHTMSYEIFFFLLRCV